MRSLIVLTLCAIGIIAPASATAGLKTSYSCDPTYYSFTGCAVIKNDVETFTAPGTLAKVRPLVSVVRNAVRCMASGGPAVWDATAQIAGGATGMAQTNGTLCAAATFVYGMRLQSGPQNYQAIVGFRVDNVSADETCVVSSYLDCKMGPQLETGRDSKRNFRVTSRPLEIKIVNTLPRPIRRTDGPYRANALSNSAIDNAYEIAPGGTGYTGSLRSVTRQSSYSAIYRVRRSSMDTTYNGASFAIDVKVGANGSKAGSCVPIYAPSKTQLTCTVDFAGTGTGNLIATVRVRP